MSDKTEKDAEAEAATQSGWVPSPEQPVPPTTTEFNALVDAGDAVPATDAESPSDAPAEGSVAAEEPTDATAETSATTEEPAAASEEPAAAPEASPAAEELAGATPEEPPAADAEPAEEAAVDAEPLAAEAAPATDAPPTAAEPPSAATAEEAAEAQVAAAETPVAEPPPAPGWDDPGPSAATVNQTGPLAGLIPEDRPELLVAAAFAGGALVAITLRFLVRR